MRFYLMVLVAMLIWSNSGVVLADDMGDYSNFIKQNYYLLDDQPFTKIECGVRVPVLDAALTNAQNQLQALPGKAVIEGDFKGFALVYDKGQGLSFTKPTFTIKAQDPGSIKDQASFDQAVANTQEGLKNQVDSISQIIAGIFEEYTLTDHKKIDHFLKTDSGAEITLENKGVVVKENYIGATRTSNISTPTGATADENSQFQKIGNGLAISKSEVKVQQPGGSFDVFLDISYAKAGDVDFPSSIINKTIADMNGVKQEADLEIYLDRCSAQ